MHRNKVKIGILGCANVAGKHAIKAFQSIDNAEVVSIADRDHTKARKWASRFGIHAENSYSALLANKNIDAVYIPLPIGLHKKWALKAADARKHIICEKSLAESLGSVKEIVDACRSKDIVLYENFMCGFHPQHGKVLSLLKKGEIGRPFIFRSFFGFPPFEKDNWRYNKKLGGSSLTDAGSHIVFMARKIFGEEPISVSCGLLYDKKTGADVKGHAFMEFPNDRSALFAFGYNSAYQNNYSLWGAHGLIEVGKAYSIPPEMKPIVNIIRNDGFKDVVIPVEVPRADHFALIFEDFCDTVLNRKIKTQKISDMYSGIIAQAKVLEALKLSSKTGKKVFFDKREKKS